ncbi:MAG: hypothetical protein KDA88_13500 [Planctomycetaceae bacterium]|nr:hypothetical protein [Planctomycetaceae bacterium]MCB9953245.1 hypothetical protein [Planctomycetaceae bacterium]
MSTVETTNDASPGTNATPSHSGGVSRVPSQSILAWLRQRDIPWYRALWNELNGDGGAGLGLSFAVHVLLLALFAIPVYHAVTSGSQFITTVAEESPQPNLILSEVDAEELVALPESGTGSEINGMVATNFDPSVTKFPDYLDPGIVKGEGDNVGDDGVRGGFRVKEPTNAVKAGNFTVFTLPIPFGREPVQPGDPPRPGQDYYIVVQMNMPTDRTVYPLRDLSGRIEGTDGYQQKIPEKAFAMSEEEKLVAVNPRRGIPVIDNVVQVFIRVPGANRQVEDTIRVSSRLLRESQELVLTFQ